MMVFLTVAMKVGGWVMKKVVMSVGHLADYEVGNLVV
jgi:hypothetical protein